MSWDRIDCWRGVGNVGGYICSAETDECGSDVGGISKNSIPKACLGRPFSSMKEKQVDDATIKKVAAHSRMICAQREPFLTAGLSHPMRHDVGKGFQASTGTVSTERSGGRVFGSAVSFGFGVSGTSDWTTAGYYHPKYVKVHDNSVEDEGFCTPASLNAMSAVGASSEGRFASSEVGQKRAFNNTDMYDTTGVSDATGLTSASELKCSPHSGGGSTADVETGAKYESEEAEREVQDGHVRGGFAHRKRHHGTSIHSTKASCNRKGNRKEDISVGDFRKPVPGGPGKHPVVTEEVDLADVHSSKEGKGREEQAGEVFLGRQEKHPPVSVEVDMAKGNGSRNGVRQEENAGTIMSGGPLSVKASGSGKVKKKGERAVDGSRMVDSGWLGKRNMAGAKVVEKPPPLPVGTLQEDGVYCSRSGRRHQPKQLPDFEDVPSFSNMRKRLQTDAVLPEPKRLKKIKGNAAEVQAKSMKNSAKGSREKGVGRPKGSVVSDAGKGKEKMPKENESAQLHPLSEFEVGDLVWAKSGQKNDPFWPAKVVDPLHDAPESVRSLCQAGRLLVMFYGPAVIRAHQRDYSWVKEGMIYPFHEYSIRFQMQALPPKSRKKAFRAALEEALLYDVGVDVDRRGTDPALSTGGHRAASTADEEMEDADVLASMEGFPLCKVLKDSQCQGCGKELTEALLAKNKKAPSEHGNLCKPCLKLYDSKQYCGVCKSVWLPNDNGSWVCCDTCSIWVHAECDRISGKRLKELQEPGGVYNCPGCRKQQAETPRKRKCPEGGRCSPEELCGEFDVPETLKVCCNGISGVYLPKKHRVMCKCKEKCKRGEKEMSVSLWEQHTSGKKKHWRQTVTVANLNLSLGDWLKNVEDGGGVGLAFCSDDKKATPNDLFGFLSVPYERVPVRWTSERCAACHLTEDHESNQMVICNRCQVGVHEYCYGVRVSSITGAWVCRACETPEVEKECFLCSVKGGALKPTDVEGLWAHVTCAWWVPGVVFQDVERMEPITGVNDINLEHFGLLCCICKQPHGACVQCSSKKCCTSYHVTCAYKAGFHISMEPDKEQPEGVSFISYCAKHRTPKRDLDCISQAAKSALKMLRWRKEMEQGGLRAGKGALSTGKAKTAKKGSQVEAKAWEGEVPKRGMRVLSPENGVAGSTPEGEGEDGNEGGSARCRPYVPRSKRAHLVAQQRGPVPYRVSGVTRHTMEQINSLRVWPEPISPDSDEVLPMKKRLQFMRETEKQRLCFGRSGIHGWGLIARRTIEAGEMVTDYRGTLVRCNVADKREQRYRAEGKDCYLFKVNDEVTIDATERGNIARLINHSCKPNCFSHIIDVEGQKHIVLIARQKVRAGEELTYDYKFDRGGEGDKKIPCLCGQPTCRMFMN